MVISRKRKMKIQKEKQRKSLNFNNFFAI